MVSRAFSSAAQLSSAFSKGLPAQLSSAQETFFPAQLAQLREKSLPAQLSYFFQNLQLCVQYFNKASICFAYEEISPLFSQKAPWALRCISIAADFLRLADYLHKRSIEISDFSEEKWFVSSSSVLKLGSLADLKKMRSKKVCDEETRKCAQMVVDIFKMKPKRKSFE